MYLNVEGNACSSNYAPICKLLYNKNTKLAITIQKCTCREKPTTNAYTLHGMTSDSWGIMGMLDFIR